MSSAPGPVLPRPPAGVVVAAALRQDGRLLAARRRYPPSLAGRWELPGGKVEPGESELAAVVRECQEELGVLVTPETRVGGDWPLVGALARTHVMHVWLARIADGLPRLSGSHDVVGWYAPGEWPTLAWLESDLPVLPLLAAELTSNEEWPPV